MDDPKADTPLARRAFLGRTAAVGGGLLLGAGGVEAIARPRPRHFAIGKGGAPRIVNGVQSGDVDGDRAVVWARTDRNARMVVEVARDERFRDPMIVRGPLATADSDFTAKVELSDLPEGQLHYRVRFHDLDDHDLVSEPTVGRFRTAREHHDVSFVVTGDCCGQGWGIDTSRGGLQTFETMRRLDPDFLLFNGDTIYADGALKPVVTDAAGNEIWRNLVTPEKSKVAETLAEYRGNYRYTLLDDNYRRFAAEVPVVAQWDDHEVVNNWYPGEVLSYRSEYAIENRVDVLAARSSRAFNEYFPTRKIPVTTSRPYPWNRVYRKLSYGDVDVFVLDMRSYRGENSTNVQTTPGAASDFLGAEQIAWLKRELKRSDATWKVISADMPIGLVVADYPGSKNWYEAIANGEPGAPKGREFEIVDILSFIKRNDIRNTVWVTADVHYAAVHHYDPVRAAWGGFLPFYEIVTGPVHAGTFGPNTLDGTFGPQVEFVKAPPAGQVNLPPSANLQFFGHFNVDHRSKELTVKIIDRPGAVLFTRTLAAEGR
jgi:alkaline phosphatase D